MESADAVVLGAGPAGLGAALALARAGARVVAVDPAPEAGGLCVTRRRDGFAYDVGGHIPFVRDEARRGWLEDLLGDDLRWVGRPVACVREGAVVRGRYLDQRPAVAEAPGPHDASARGELASRFGARFVDGTIRPYLEKVDGVPLESIPGERALKLLENQAAPDGFHFPARGIGQLMDAMAAAARRAGADLRLATGAEAIEAPSGRVSGVRLSGGGSGPDPAGGGGDARGGRGADPRAPPARYRAGPGADAGRGDRLPEDRGRAPERRALDPGGRSARAVRPGVRARQLESPPRPPGPDPDRPRVLLPGRRRPTRCGASTTRPSRRPARGPSTTPWACSTTPRAPQVLEVLRIPRAYPVADLAQVPAVRAPALWLDGLEGAHLAPGAAVIEAVEAGERAAAAVLAGRA